MGCNNSKPEAGGGGDVRRRRLSIGGAETEVEQPTQEEVEEDRGLIQSLSEKNIVQMLEEMGNDGDRKMSIGSNTDQGKTSFSNKAMEKLGDQLDPASSGLGYTCRKGLKPDAPNQDSWTILRLDGDRHNCSIYCVMDGHGQKGHDVSQFVKENLIKLIVKDQRFMTDQMPAMLKDCFKRMQSLILSADRLKKLSAQMSGTTCTLAIHDHSSNKVTVAHVADSTAVLGRCPGQGKRPTAEQLTRDHKPNLPDERKRIEAAGGRVVFDGYANHRVYARSARYPGLNMSRCLGDLMGHADCGITCEPEVKELVLKPEDTHLLLCSDGVWEFIEPAEAVGIVADFKPQQAMQAAERLAKESWDRWIQEEGGTVVDDITVILINLTPNGNRA